MNSGFNAKKFETTNFIYREKEVDVPELKEFFDGRKKPIWIVRGLTGIEMAGVRDAVTKNQNFEKLIEQLTSSLSKDKVEAVTTAFGMGDDLPDDYVRRLKILKLGSVDPVLPHDQVVKLADTFAVTFSRLTVEIMIVTGAGKLGESNASGTIQK
jgi:hypothetical protein